jgi:hypothetical protein
MRGGAWVHVKLENGLLEVTTNTDDNGAISLLDAAKFQRLANAMGLIRNLSSGGPPQAGQPNATASPAMGFAPRKVDA